MNTIQFFPQYYPDPTIGRPISSGSIYVGIPDLDPEILGNQKTLSVRQEDGTVVTVTQPISTNAGGVPEYLGSPVTLLVAGDYSLKILDSGGSQVYYMPTNVGLNNSSYYPDYDAIDQGITGDNNTIKYYIDAIGTDDGTIVLKHNSGNATTTYTVTTDAVKPGNVEIIFEKGAILGGTGILSGFQTTYPEWFGQIDGTEDEVQINAAIEALRVSSITAKTSANQKIASNFTRKKLILEGDYKIDNPILCEGEEYSNIEADNIIIDGMNVGRVTMNSGFTGVTRYYDSTADGFATITAAILMGGRDFGKDGGNHQVYSGVKRLQIIGAPSGSTTQTAQIGIWDEFSHRNEYTDLYFEALGYGIKARCPVNVYINNLKARRCASLITVYFDVPDIRAVGDYTGEWTSAHEANDVNITDVYFQSTQSYLTDDATTALTSGIRLYNVGEYKLNNITLFGGFHGLTLDNLDGASHGYRWGIVDNLEIAQTEGYGLKLENVNQIMLGIIDVTWCVWDFISSSNITYTESPVQIKDCNQISFETLTIDRNNSSADMKGGHSLLLDGSYGCSINTLRSFGMPGNADDTYSHVSFIDSDFCLFNSVNLGYSFNASYLFKYGIILDNDSGNNTFNNINPFDIGSNLKTRLVSLGTAARNTLRRSTNTITSTNEGGTIDVAGINVLLITNSAAQNITDFTSGYAGQVVTVIFSNSNSTIYDSAGAPAGTFELSSGTSFTGDANDTIVFIKRGASWIELLRSVN